jgi:hypothetical protein
MGRPINKRYFGSVSAGGIGGESVASVAIATTGTLYSTTTVATFSSPQLPGGVLATANVTITTGTVTAVQLVNPGSGYTSAPTLTLSPATTGTTATFTVQLASAVENVIAVTAWVKNGSAALVADAVKQVSSQRYRVTNSEGTSVCSLVGADPAAEGEMNILAEDSAGNSYYVTKLTSRRAVVTQKSGSGFEFVNDQSVGWNLLAAEANVSVKVVNN